MLEDRTAPVANLFRASHRQPVPLRASSNQKIWAFGNRAPTRFLLCPRADIQRPHWETGVSPLIDMRQQVDRTGGTLPTKEPAGCVTGG